MTGFTEAVVGPTGYTLPATQHDIVIWLTGATYDVEKVFYAHRELRVGGLIHNDVSAWRADQMPYGGVKSSGIGKEGLRYAMEEMTEPRIMVLSHVPL